MIKIDRIFAYFLKKKKNKNFFSLLRNKMKNLVKKREI